MKRTTNASTPPAKRTCLDTYHRVWTLGGESLSDEIWPGSNFRLPSTLLKEDNGVFLAGSFAVAMYLKFVLDEKFDKPNDMDIYVEFGGEHTFVDVCNQMSSSVVNDDGHLMQLNPYGAGDKHCAHYDHRCKNVYEWVQCVDSVHSSK